MYKICMWKVTVILMKEIEIKDLNKWGDKSCSWIRRCSIVKISVLKCIYIFNVITIKIPLKCFIDVDKVILKFIWIGKDLEQPTRY